jgi:hypothetical protein
LRKADDDDAAISFNDDAQLCFNIFVCFAGEAYVGARGFEVI